MAPSFGWDHLFVGGLITVAAASQIFKVISERREQRLIRFCQKMPKIDLHAHLSGCVRPSTLLELSKNKGTELSIQAERLLSASSYIKRESRTLSECFEIFNLIHSIMNNKETLRRVVYEALYDFYHDNVVYLELRTTPRQLPDGTSKREYIETVLEVIRSFTSDKKCFHVKLLLSIDRASRDFEDSKNTMNLCIEYYIKDNLVVGVDVGGNPTKGSLEYLEPILLQAKEHNIPITLHCGEVCNDKEMEFVLNFNPNRLGHALFLNHSHVNELLSRPKALKIPIELCPTSNMKTLLLETLDHHPTAKRWMTEDYPFSINTDDSGVFDTCSSNEYYTFAETLQVSPLKLSQILKNSVDHAFCASKTRNMLRKKIEKDCKRLLFFDKIFGGVF